MEIKHFKLGEIKTNVYLLIDKGILIDCEESEVIYDYLVKNKIQLKYIFLTHLHPDHVNGLEFLKNKTGALICGSDKDVDLLEKYLGIKVKLDKILVEGEFQSIKVISTPGHSPGSLCFLIEDRLFSGDTLFYHTYGRTDLPGGSEEDMKKSLKKLFKLDKNIRVFPGHGKFTTIEEELSI